MAHPVNPARPYRSPTRERQRATTRAAIVAVARELFVERGYDATTINAIAEGADVSSESVYAIFGNKRELLRSVAETAAAGDDSSSGVLRDDWLDRVRAEPDQRRRFAIMTEATRDTLRRVAPIDAVIRAVAITDPEIADLQREHDRRRLADIRVLVGLLAEAGPLRMPVDAAADLMWALCLSTGLYRALTSDRRWSDKRAFDALNDALARTLLPDERESAGR